MAKKVHIPRSIHSGAAFTDRARTLCGRDLLGCALIKNGSIREATCFVCLGSDDRLQVEQHRRECALAKIDPNTLEPLTAPRSSLVAALPIVHATELVRQCRSRWLGYSCNLEAGHAGDHQDAGRFTVWPESAPDAYYYTADAEPLHRGRD